jgi:hypothetical protein
MPMTKYNDIQLMAVLVVSSFLILVRFGSVRFDSIRFDFIIAYCHHAMTFIFFADISEKEQTKPLSHYPPPFVGSFVFSGIARNERTNVPSDSCPDLTSLI